MTSSLVQRDALLSWVSGVVWPYAPLLDALNLAPELAVLDVGAGEGLLLRELQRRGHTGRLTGIDPEPGEGVQQGSADHLPLTAASFDVVIFLRVLAHLPDPAAALAEARRVLKPGGFLVMAANSPAHLRDFWRVLGETIPEAQPTESGVQIAAHFTEEEAAELAATYGKSWPGGELDDYLHLNLTIEKRP